MSTAEATEGVERRILQDYVQNSWGKLRYWHSEPKQGLPLVLIHGFGGRLEHWRRVMRPLAREHTVYALDMPGFGRSDKPRARYTRPWLAEQVHTFLTEVVRQPAVLVGHSMGGMVAAQVAHTYGDAVQGLVLVDSSGMLDPERPYTPFEQLLFRGLLLPGVGELVALVMGNKNAVRQGLMQSYHDKSRVSEELVELLAEPLLTPEGRNAYLAVSREFQSYLLEIQPGDVAVPTLIVWGEDDTAFRVGMANHYKERMFPQATTAIISNCGHCPFDERPEAFCDALLPWLSAAIS